MLLFLFPLRVFIFHKLQMQMWLCPFPINSSRHRVSSRSQPQFLYRTKITKGGASVQAIVWQYSHPQHSIGTEISTERRMNGRGRGRGSGGDLSDSSALPSVDSWLVTLLFGAVSSLAVAMCPSLVDFIPSRLESLMILTTVDGVNNKNFTISLQMIVWCIELLYIKFLAELMPPSRANVERKFSKLSILYYFICVWLPCESILITFICMFFLFQFENVPSMADILHSLRLCATAPSRFHSNFTECAKDFQADGADLLMFEVKSCVKMSRRQNESQQQKWRGFDSSDWFSDNLKENLI